MYCSGRLEGKVAIITGGASGLGRASAVWMAAEGAKICLADINQDLGDKAVEMIAEKGSQGMYVQCDVSDPDACRGAVDETLETFGRLDILLTSAGIHGGGRTVVDTEVERWQHVLAVDLFGAFCISKYAVPHMQTQSGGSVIHIASIGGLKGSPHAPAFEAAKGGLVNLTRHMAIAHGPENIRTNCLAPGVVRTEMTRNWLDTPGVAERVAERNPMKKIATPDEVAAVVAFLASDDASFVNGAIIPVDGGLIAGW